MTVTFAPSGRRGTFPVGTAVLDAARHLGVDLDTVCGGRGICGRCQISIGERPGVDADPARLAPPTTTETDYHGRRPLTPDRRLGCAATVRDDVVVIVPPESQVHRHVVRKDIGVTDVRIDPAILLRYVEVGDTSLEAQAGEAQRLRLALAETWDLTDVRIGHGVLSALQAALEEGRRAVTVAVRDAEVVAVWPGLRDRVHGVAVDIGSTTIAAHLCDLHRGTVLASAGRMNPQVGYGEDLMSRVSYAMVHPEGRERLTTAIQAALNEMVAELCADADVDLDGVLEICLVANPIMHHMALGLDPRPLGTAPFALATTDAVVVAAREIGLDLHPGAQVHALGCIAGHVGADTAGMILSEAPQDRDDLTLLVDVGTNAEIVLGDRTRLLAASSPTGPAFEGAQISAGQRAVPGAIDRVRVDPVTLSPRYTVIGSPLWSDAPGFAEAVASTGVTGICGSGIIDTVAELFLAGVIRPDGQLRPPPGTDDHPRVVPHERTHAYRLVDADPARGQPAVEITQNDVRAIQLAKAALHAGCRLLMDHLGVDTVDRVRLAGAFGSHIDPLRALILGLVPDCDPDRVEAAGNAAGTGAVMALLSVAARREIEQVTARVEKIETAVEPAFQAHFVAAMGFPHSTASYPRLTAQMTLPPRPAATTDGTPGRAGGRRGGRRGGRPGGLGGPARPEPASTAPHSPTRRSSS